MDNKIWYVEILNRKLEKEISKIKKEKSETFHPIELVVYTGEVKKLFVFSKKEVEELISKKVPRKHFKIFTSFEENSNPVSVSVDIFKYVFMKIKA